MTKITLQTTVNIDFNAWVLQAKRFAKITDTVKFNRLPLDEPTSGLASIEITYNKPLNNGFYGEITYVQHYTKDILDQQYDNDFNPVGDPVPKTVDARHEVIKYNQFIDKASIEYLLDSTLALIPDTVTGYFNREKKAVELICLENALDHFTFNLADGQIIIK